MRAAVMMLGAALALTACDQRMINQPKDKPYGTSQLFPDNRVAQAPPHGTVARDEVFWSWQTSQRPTMTTALLTRGQERYDAFCSPCHARTGDGDGMIVQRGMPPPPSFHSKSLREVSDRHILQVITDGYGAMYSYTTRVPPDDRWAIAAYIRALQFSRNAEVADLPDEVRQKLKEHTQ